MLFAVLSIVAFVRLLTSFVFGGRGVAELYKTGYEGNWTIQTTREKFNKQTLLALIGTGFVLASIFCGRPKEDDIRKEILANQSDIAATKQRLQTAETELAKVKSNIDAACSNPIATTPKKSRR